jgi:hypothetical protein
MTHQNFGDARNLRDNGELGQWRPAPAAAAGVRRLKSTASPWQENAARLAPPGPAGELGGQRARPRPTSPDQRCGGYS